MPLIENDKIYDTHQQFWKPILLLQGIYSSPAALSTLTDRKYNIINTASAAQQSPLQLISVT